MTVDITQREMDKHGVGWFKFDEASGNVTDSKGTAVGTLNGGVTRVAGFNGQGKALSFNGTNSYVQFNQKVLPLGKKNIRIKIETSMTPSVLGFIFAEGSETTNSGLYAAILPSGAISFRQGKGTPGSWNFEINTNSVINDGIWHDVLFTWDGTTNSNGIKIYVDDMSVPDTIGTASSLESIIQTSNLRLGSRPSGNDFYFKGRIDNLEIYNDVIDPFDHKYLISDDSQGYSKKSGIWTPTGALSEQNYKDNGMDSLTREDFADLGAVVPSGKITVMKI